MENSAGARLTEHAKNIGDEAKQAAQETHGALADAASRYAGQAKDYAKHGYDYASKKSQELKTTTEGYITSNPWYAVGIALGVGVLIGLVARGRSND